MPIEKKEIKVRIDSKLLDQAKEYDIDLDLFFSNELAQRVNEITFQRELEKIPKEYEEHEHEQKIIEIIKRMSKSSTFDYAIKDGIIAEAELQGINREEALKILNKLEAKRVITKEKYYI